MKKSIYISGITCANLMMLGCVFKVLHWPGAGPLLILSVFLFCFLFLPSALLASYREQKKHAALHVVTFIVFFICTMGILFKVQHWPGASAFLLIGIPLPFILFLPVYLYQTRNEKKEGNLNFLGIMFGLIFLAVFSVLLALNVSKDVLSNFAERVSSNDNLASFTHAKSKQYRNLNSIKNSSDELFNYIENLKCELLNATRNNLCENNRLSIDYNPSQIFNPENTEVSMKILYGKGEKDKINELKTKINSYKELLVASGKMTPELTELVSELFDVSTPKTENPNDANLFSWEHNEFSSYQLIIVLDVLSQIQSNVRLVESEYLAMK